MPTYIPSAHAGLDHASGYELADELIIRLRESNALEFMPPEQRMALIRELSADVFYSEE
jgi:hypothetical protein